MGGFKKKPPTWAEIRIRSMPQKAFAGFNDGTFGRHCHLSVNGLSWPRRGGKHTRPLTRQPRTKGQGERACECQCQCDRSCLAQGLARSNLAQPWLGLPGSEKGTRQNRLIDYEVLQLSPFGLRPPVSPQHPQPGRGPRGGPVRGHQSGREGW